MDAPKKGLAADWDGRDSILKPARLVGPPPAGGVRRVCDRDGRAVPIDAGTLRWRTTESSGGSAVAQPGCREHAMAHFGHAVRNTTKLSQEMRERQSTNKSRSVAALLALCQPRQPDRHRQRAKCARSRPSPRHARFCRRFAPRQTMTIPVRRAPLAQRLLYGRLCQLSAVCLWGRPPRINLPVLKGFRCYCGLPGFWS